MQYVLPTFRATLWVGLLAGTYLAILPMSGTIALRNLVLVLLLLLTLRSLLQNWRKSVLGWPVVLWALYVLVFPLFAQDHAEAWKSLAGQWGRSLMALLAGAGVASAMVSDDREPGSNLIFFFGLASAVSLLTHLFLLGVAFWTTGVIPWGSWGRESHHADLGYAAGHAVILLGVYVVCGSRRFRWSALVLVLLSFLSLLLARSRAGLLFGLLAGVFILAIALFAKSGEHRSATAVWALVALLLGGVLFAVAYKADPRWDRLLGQATSAWGGDALQIECDGGGMPAAPGPTDGGPQIHVGDGSRIILMRAGLALALEYPWGLDGSKQAFQKRLRQVCEKPAFLMAHTHNGWLDTILAIGWAGAAFYMVLFLHFLRCGWLHRWTGGALNPWAVVLLTAGVFWILRGMLDSVFRDHQLEMQGFLLAYAGVTLKLGKHPKR